MTMNAAPGPKGYPGVGVVPRLARDPIAFCTEAMRTYDDLVRLDLGFASAYLVTLPEHIQHVLVDNQDNYWKGKIFNRARFLPERAEGRSRHAYYPFGTGPRMCIGRHFANLEMLLVLAMTAQQWRPRLAPGRPVEPVARIAIRSKNGVWMNLEKG